MAMTIGIIGLQAYFNEPIQADSRQRSEILSDFFSFGTLSEPFSALDLSDDKSPAPAAPQTEEKPQQEQQEQKPEEVATEEQKPAKPKSTKPEPIYMPYVVIGTGTAAFAAANAIRERDPGAQVPVYAPVFSWVAT